MRSLCVEYALLCADTRRPSVIMRRYWLETAHVHLRPTSISRMNSACNMFIAERKCLNVERSWNVRVWTRSVSNLCVGRASNVCGILHRIFSYVLTCAIFQWFVSDCKWYMRDSSMFSTPDIPKIWSISRRTNPTCAWILSDSCMIGCVTGP